MKQLFSASLTWNEAVSAVGTDFSSYTDEEHLSGNRKRLTQLSKRSGTFPAVKPQPIDCNPPSTAVAASSATFDASAQALAFYCQQYIKAHTSFDGGYLIPTAEISPDDPRVITGDLPVVDFEPPKVEIRSGLSGSFPRQNSGEWKMKHWTKKKLAGTDAWDTRVQESVTEYVKNSKYTTSSDSLPVMRDDHREGESFIEFDSHEETPAIERFARGEAKMLTDFNSQSGGIRKLHKPAKMIECADAGQTMKPVEPSNSFDTFSSFVSFKNADSAKTDGQDAFTASACESTCDVIELIVVTEEPIEIHDDLDDLIADCIAAAQSYEVLTAEFDNAIDVTQTVISCAPRMTAKFNFIDYTGNIAVTVADSVYISESNNVAGYAHEQLNFDPNSFAAETIEMNSVDEAKGAEVEIQNLTMLPIEDCDAADFAVANVEPARKSKGSSRSKKAQMRREKRSKKRDAAVTAAHA
jgi:hypothetical protein